MLIFLLSLFSTAPAQAEFTFACGDHRDKGPKFAEIALVDSLESSMKLLFAGAEAATEEKLGFKALDGGRWMVSIDKGPGKGSRKFVFNEIGTLQEFSISKKGKESRSGPEKKCDYKVIAAPKE